MCFCHEEAQKTQKRERKILRKQNLCASCDFLWRGYLSICVTSDPNFKRTCNDRERNCSPRRRCGIQNPYNVRTWTSGVCLRKSSFVRIGQTWFEHVRQKPVPIVYETVEFDEGFRADIIVEEKVILELKSVEDIARVHKKQLLTYIRLADKRLGLLINFGAPLIKTGITRIVNGLQE